MDLLVRHKAANENADQTVEAETQDHMDHTYGSCACAARALLMRAFPSMHFPSVNFRLRRASPRQTAFGCPSA
jgi:hypothetical protein